MLWLMRLRHWVTHPPSRDRMRLILIVAVLCFVIVLIEWAGLWPDALTTQGGGTLRVPRP